MIGSMQFQVAYDFSGDHNPDGGTWHDIGVVHLDPPTLGDMSARTASIQWNTSVCQKATPAAGHRDRRMRQRTDQRNGHREGRGLDASYRQDRGVGC